MNSQFQVDDQNSIYQAYPNTNNTQLQDSEDVRLILRISLENRSEQQVEFRCKNLMTLFMSGLDKFIYYNDVFTKYTVNKKKPLLEKLYIILLYYYYFMGLPITWILIINNIINRTYIILLILYHTSIQNRLIILFFV